MQAEIGRPSSLQPDKGKVSVFIDCSPTAEPTFGVSFSMLWPGFLSYLALFHICSFVLFVCLFQLHPCLSVSSLTVLSLKVANTL